MKFRTSLPLIATAGFLLASGAVIAGDKTKPETEESNAAATTAMETEKTETETMSEESDTETTSDDMQADIAMGDAEAGEKIFKKDCRACHGPKGKGVSAYPKLAGLEYEYIVDRLERYRAGEKFGPNTMLMAPRAKNLSDEDILDVATFITTLE
ncbi:MULTISPECIES: c-type cytochrome [unclassified Sulfitobacter]|uniref:c-type cytochrome n=1 Tax=unclassified Sulfitobacter TaxID=196795 RepID=UPI0007C3604E|nr:MULTISPECIES: c-type cytochrome [unclassified Sulfitobacter]KZX94672.1 hypothetical protein A3721_09620 [Sulfitobacter sp. HI0023]KZY22600.1 hypothetical protein A3728_10605 [Sulfitobacter sp. HI0040]KZZ68490.1 hypothetical protein A3764_12810 [Sulfitobacter sp. HI0129]